MRIRGKKRALNNFFITVLIIGLSGLVAQVLVLRELFVSFYGNELTLGITLANWILAEAIGVFIIGKFIDRVKNKINVLIFLQLIFSVYLPFSVYLARTFKYSIGIPFGEGIGLSAIFYSSLLILLPLGFCHGSLFSAASKIYSLDPKQSTHSIARIYSWETLGTILGGIVFTYIFIPYCNSFQIAFILSTLNLLICLFFFANLSNILRFCIVCLIFIAGITGLFAASGKLDAVSINKQWPGQEVLASRNSIYGNITATKRQGQYTFFYNGLPIITSPCPDKQFVEDFGDLPLLFSEAPKKVLVISSGAGGLINEIIKHPVQAIDYVEIDPLLIKMLEKFPIELTERELKDKRLRIINSDGRLFLRVNPGTYDVILIGLSNQSVLTTNRLFTKEFFSLAKKRLNPKGIFAIWLIGSETYLSKELKDLNLSVLGGLRQDFEFVRVIPGNYNIVLASSDKSVIDTPVSLISKRIDDRGILTSFLKPAYIDYRLSKYWQDWFTRETAGSKARINRDFRPIAVFESLLLWNKKFSPKLEHILEYSADINLKWVAGFIIILTMLLLYFIRESRNNKFAVAYGIAATGFFAMLANLVLIFGFQIFYGYLYQKIGLLISIFMAGIAFGSIYVAKKLENIMNAVSAFILLEILMIVFSCIMAMALIKLSYFPQYAAAVFIALFFICGLLAGSQFPIAGKIYLKDKHGVGEVSGILYCADLLGGWIAGILGGIILLPVMGILNTCLVIIIVKAGSLFLLVPQKKALTNNTI